LTYSCSCRVNTLLCIGVTLISEDFRRVRKVSEPKKQRRVAVDYVFVRPNGRPYRPRTDKLRARAWENQGQWDDDSCGVVVFGTLNADEARSFATESAVYWYGPGSVREPRSGWWRVAIRQNEQVWVEDEIRGAPGVRFTWEPSDGNPIKEEVTS
jgi:hypothetical protein